MFQRTFPLVECTASQREIVCSLHIVEIHFKCFGKLFCERSGRECDCGRSCVRARMRNGTTDENRSRRKIRGFSRFEGRRKCGASPHLQRHDRSNSTSPSRVARTGWDSRFFLRFSSLLARTTRRNCVVECTQKTKVKQKKRREKKKRRKKTVFKA